MEGWTDSAGWAGPEKGELRGLLRGLHCPPGPAAGGGGGHLQADGRGLARRPAKLWVGRQDPPARPRRCSTPARNGAAEPRASALYIVGGAELRRSCAPPGWRGPRPLRARSLAHAREEAEAGRPGRLFAGAAPIGPLWGDVTDSISKASITRQWSTAASQGEGAARHVSQPLGCAVARRLLGAREAEGRAGACLPSSRSRRVQGRRLGEAADRPGQAGRAIAVAGREGSRGRGWREAAENLGYCI